MPKTSNKEGGAPNEIDEDIFETPSGIIKTDLAKKLSELNQRSGQERKGPSAFDKIQRFRGDYANAYSPAMMLLGAGKIRYFPIDKFSEYQLNKIKAELKAINIDDPAEIEKKLQGERQQLSEQDLLDIEATNKLVDEVNEIYKAFKEGGHASADEAEHITKELYAKMKQIDDIVKRKK